MDGSLTQAPESGAEPPRERWWQRLNPWRHFAAALGWAMFALVVAGALVAAEWAADEAERHVAAAAHLRLVQTANQAGDALLAQLQGRLAALGAVAAQWSLAAPDAATGLAGARLAALQAREPELSWLGVFGADHHWVAQTDDWPGAQALQGQAWLAQAAHQSVVALHRTAAPDQADALLLAVPLTEAGAAGAGVLVAQLPWLWLQAQMDAHLRAVGGGASFELLLLEPDGTVLAGPRAVRDRLVGFDWSEGGRYLVGRAEALPVPAARTDGGAPTPAWQLWVRESAAQALAPARETHRAVLAGVLGVGLLAALAAAGVAQLLLRRLDALARQARAVRRGERNTIEVPTGHDEVHAIGVTLAALVAHLQQEKQALTRLNAGLDARVAARTARIERLAADARLAAVTRERLRLARGLHDTLAHSLMALLTQVRLVRKLGARWSREQLDAELAATEQVATQGLAEVRAAIGQMRASGVQDSGLGPELRALLARFAERSGVTVQADIDEAADALVNERAATVFAIAREALRNAEHHAQARQVWLALHALADDADVDAPPTWQLTLRDDGRGFDTRAAHDGHFGLVGLREQAEQLGARLALTSAPGQGCRVELVFAA